MIFSQDARKLALTAHIVASVGWLGAVAAFFALALVGLCAGDPLAGRAAYLAMESLGWLVIVPFAISSLVTGVVESLGTSWGLLRHYWVVIKLVLTALATVVLLIHMRPIGLVAEAATQHALASGELRGLRLQLVGDAAAALLILLVATVLGVYKPRGMTRYGRSELASRRDVGRPSANAT